MGKRGPLASMCLLRRGGEAASAHSRRPQPLAPDSSRGVGEQGRLADIESFDINLFIINSLARAPKCLLAPRFIKMSLRAGRGRHSEPCRAKGRGRGWPRPAHHTEEVSVETKGPRELQAVVENMEIWFYFAYLLQLEPSR